ncbi:hypothetical protein PGB90_010447 [Kerria lacca]
MSKDPGRTPYQWDNSIEKLPILEDGSTNVLRVNNHVLAVVRELFGFELFVLLTNFDYSAVKVNARAKIGSDNNISIYVSSVKSGLKRGLVVSTSQLILS